MIEVQNKKVTDWVAECAAMTKPEEIVWIDGSEAQLEAIRALAVETGEMIRLNEEKLPGCYYYRTDPKDVARDEKRTVICTTEEKDAGPTNNWVQKDEMYAKMRKLFDGSMKGRTMYVIPYSMGVVGSKFSKIGIEITDSIYVVLSMNIMTRIGDPVIEELNKGADFVKCLHSKAQVNAENKYIAQFPEENTIWSINSAYGGNVLLGKKCFALRIGSVLGKREGWMAEHMLILCVEAPNGEKKYISAAFPSACGKTNLAMLIPPKHLQEKGYKVYTIGDDIAWLRVGDDGRLYAVNPENGFFGVAPGTNSKTNNNALMTTKKIQFIQTLQEILMTTPYGGKALISRLLQTVSTGRQDLGTVRKNRQRRQQVKTSLKELIQIQDSLRLRKTALPSLLNFSPAKAFRSARLSSAAAVQNLSR